MVVSIAVVGPAATVDCVCSVNVVVLTIITENVIYSEYHVVIKVLAIN